MHTHRAAGLSNGTSAPLHQILKITPTLKIAKNVRTLRRHAHHLPIKSQAYSMQPENNGTSTSSPQNVENTAIVGSQSGSSVAGGGGVKSLAVQRSAALASLLRSTAVPDAAVAKQLGLTEDYLQALMELPGTSSITELKTRLVALSQWQSSLRRGVLPTPGSVDWPAEPFRSKFIDVLKKLEMPRFTRRYPKLLGSLLKQFLDMAKDFEGELLEEQAKQQQQQEQQQQQQQQQQTSSQSPNNSDDQQCQKSEQENSQSGMSGNEKEDPDGQSEKADEQGNASGQEGKQEGEIQMELEDMEGGQPDPNKDANPTEADPSSTQDNSGYAEQLAEQMLQKFEENWAPAMEALDTASQAFEDIDGLMDGPEGFDNSKSVWQQSGWREVAALRKKLEELRELRELVRSLGRGGGKGPLKKAPQQLYKTGAPPGVIRTEQSPEETRGLTRSGDLSRMLPMEAHLLAAGWPRRNKNIRNSNNGNGERELSSVNAEDEDSGLPGKEDEGSRACRLLFMARRAERQLMSYERTGWSENEPSRVTGRLEMRPAAELGPIIVCLDTSGSMHGAREVVAKALTLECMRGAHRQGRKCFVYAFSGPGDVMDLELGNDSASMLRLLNFLTMSFSGGTDVDAPLALSLERLTREEWELADILMVTDGEIPSPNEDILNRLELATETMGLEVHGLLVGRNVTEPMKQLCTHLHVFKSWSAVGGDGMNY
ncbi:hypothetical protein Ndes2526B_g08972 [Nannochloris sp. 'desiccata']